MLDVLAPRVVLTVQSHCLGLQFPGPGHLAQVWRPQIGELVLLGRVRLHVCARGVFTCVYMRGRVYVCPCMWMLYVVGQRTCECV